VSTSVWAMCSAWTSGSGKGSVCSLLHVSIRSGVCLLSVLVLVVYCSTAAGHAIAWAQLSFSGARLAMQTWPLFVANTCRHCVMACVWLLLCCAASLAAWSSCLRAPLVATGRASVMIGRRWRETGSSGHQVRTVQSAVVSGLAVGSCTACQ
jgi:hypothetical protein